MICGACNSDTKVMTTIINFSTKQKAQICLSCRDFLQFNPDWIAHHEWYDATDNSKLTLKEN